ncbi:MAG TPA: hypothetical protein PKJ69_10965 [Spirochaetota bacterium]|nr:hypothetical protein [Spirochaetota bacterium]HQL44225.1 hypothetical protein [Spirochaetota bacterium]
MANECHSERREEARCFVWHCQPEPCPELGSGSNGAYLDSGISPE